MSRRHSQWLQQASLHLGNHHSTLEFFSIADRTIEASHLIPDFGGYQIGYAVLFGFGLCDPRQKIAVHLLIEAPCNHRNLGRMLVS